jgi:hypothetical protein
MRGSFADLLRLQFPRIWVGHRYSILTQQLQQFGNIRRDPPRLFPREQLRRRSTRLVEGLGDAVRRHCVRFNNGRCTR